MTWVLVCTVAIVPLGWSEAAAPPSPPHRELDLSWLGPRCMQRRPLYMLKVTNLGTTPATETHLRAVVPVGFAVVAVDADGSYDDSTRTASWFPGEIGPGQTREVKIEVQAVSPGEHRLKASVVAAGGLRAEAEMVTRVEGLSALLVELVDTDDPVEVNGETSYEVRITNTGSKTETDIKLIATIPDKMQYKSANGPTSAREEGRQIVFAPLAKLAPQADAIYRINVKAIEAGTVYFKIQYTSSSLTEPGIKNEATRIYFDCPTR